MPNCRPTAPALTAQSLQHIALTLAAESIFVKQELGAISAEWALGSEFALEQMGITQAELDEIAADGHLQSWPLSA